MRDAQFDQIRRRSPLLIRRRARVGWPFVASYAQDGAEKSRLFAFITSPMWLTLVLLIQTLVEGFEFSRMLRRKEMVGLWRLTSKSFLPRPPEEETQPALSSWASIVGGLGIAFEGGVLLMLKEDGSFVQYGTATYESAKSKTAGGGSKESSPGRRNDDVPFRTLEGVWDYVEDILILALDRPTNADGRQVHDTTFTGKVAVSQITKALSDDLFGAVLDESEVSGVFSDDEGKKIGTGDDVFLSIAAGEICIGRFMYPKNHPCFFEQPAPIFNPQLIGGFQLRQVMGVLNAFNTEKKEIVIPKFKESDFYGKKFILTSEPIQMKRPKKKLKWSKKEGKYVEDGPTEDPDRPFDVRVMPIDFFQNNTFCATGASKILRGRFSVEGPEKDKLWFAVSLFGSGRSAPGSVYSEGPGLSHEDKRSYIGNIEVVRKNWDKGATVDDEVSENSLSMFVEGAITVGHDMGTDTRAIPVARFTLREVVTTFDYVDDSDEEWSEPNGAFQ